MLPYTWAVGLGKITADIDCGTSKFRAFQRGGEQVAHFGLFLHISYLFLYIVYIF